MLACSCMHAPPAEMAGLNAVARTLVRILYGAALMHGTYPAALEHYQAASQLAPHNLIHRVEVGRTLAKVGAAACTHHFGDRMPS